MTVTPGDLAKRPLHRIQLAPVMDRHPAGVPSGAAGGRGTGLVHARADTPTDAPAASLEEDLPARAGVLVIEVDVG